MGGGRRGGGRGGRMGDVMNEEEGMIGMSRGEHNRNALAGRGSMWKRVMHWHIPANASHTRLFMYLNSPPGIPPS